MLLLWLLFRCDEVVHLWHGLLPMVRVARFCTVLETSSHGRLQIGVMWVVNFGKDWARHVLLVAAILRLVLLFGRPLILLLLLLCAGLEAGLQCVNLDLERSQKLV